MITKRIIPCLDVNDGRVVKGVNFVNLIDAGDPVEIAAAYDKAGADVDSHINTTTIFINIPAVIVSTPFCINRETPWRLRRLMIKQARMKWRF